MQSSMTYKDAGVNIDAGDELVQRIKKHVTPTFRKEVLGNLGGFGAFFELPTQKYKNPVLVSCTDGVGTKLRLAIDYHRPETIGIDCVAMCANDCVVSGAEPLWFLDYFACNQLDVIEAEKVIQGIAKGCLETGMSLIGGETAEMPNMYHPGDYDIAGFCVGIVEKNKIINGQDIKPGDKLIALSSSGAHSNGYSLIRKIIERSKADLNQSFEEGHTLLDALLMPTKLYVKPPLPLMQEDLIKGAAHITGGGILENVPRCLPDGVMARINLKSWEWPKLFQWLQIQGNITHHEMIRTFNCGVGMVLCVEETHVDACLTRLIASGERPWVIGDITADDHDKKIECI